MSCLSQVASSSSSSSLCSLPTLLGVSVCGSPAGQRLGRVLGLGMLLPLPAVPVPVGGVRLSLDAAVLAVFSGSSLLSPPNLLFLTVSPAFLRHLPLLPVTSRGGGRKRSPHSLLALWEERGGVELSLRVARVPTLGHGEIPQRPLLVVVCAAGSLLLGRDVRDGSGLS